MDKDKCSHNKAKLQDKKLRIYKCVKCGKRIKVVGVGEVQFCVFLRD